MAVSCVLATASTPPVRFVGAAPPASVRPVPVPTAPTKADAVVSPVMAHLGVSRRNLERTFHVLLAGRRLRKAALAGRAVWFIAAMYVCCAIMRLARFNVETEPDVASHMVFKGLPSPAAALSVTRRW